MNVAEEPRKPHRRLSNWLVVAICLALALATVLLGPEIIEATI